MSAEAPESHPVVAVEDEDRRVIIAWLNSDESDAWRRSRAQRDFWTGQDTSALSWNQAPGDQSEDPCGRPPGAGVETAPREAG